MNILKFKNGSTIRSSVKYNDSSKKKINEIYINETETSVRNKWIKFLKINKEQPTFYEFAINLNSEV